MWDSMEQATRSRRNGYLPCSNGSNIWLAHRFGKASVVSSRRAVPSKTPSFQRPPFARLCGRSAARIGVPIRRDSGTFRHERHLDDDSPQIGIRQYAELDALPVSVEKQAVVDRSSVPHWFGAEGPGS